MDKGHSTIYFAKTSPWHYVPGELKQLTTTVRTHVYRNGIIFVTIATIITVTDCARSKKV